MDYDAHTGLNARPAVFLTELGNNLILNGDFADGEDHWTFGSEFSLDAGTALKTAGEASALIQSLTNLVDGKLYIITYTVTNFVGTGFFQANLGGAPTVQRSTDGTFVEEVRAGAQNSLFIFDATSDTTFNVDDISVDVPASLIDPLTIDTTGFESLEYFIQTGTTVGGFSVGVQEGNDAALLDGAFVPADEVIGGPIEFISGETEVVKRIGVVGKKRFQQLVFSDITGENIVSAVVVLNNPKSSAPGADIK